MSDLNTLLNVAEEVNVGVTDYILYHTFDNADLSGSSYSDQSGNGHTVTLSNSPTTGVAGNFGEAVTFNGSTQCGVIAEDVQLKPTNSVTIAAWVKTTGTANYRGVFSCFGSFSGLTGYEIQIGDPTGSGRLRANFCSGTGSTLGVDYITAISDSNILNNGSWHHVAATFDGSNARLYINGSLNKIEPFTGTLGYHTTNNFRVGCRNHSGTNSEYFDGSIDDLRIYNRALSDEEITSVYNNESGITGDGTLPIGGTTGQVLEKIDETDYNVQWADSGVPANTAVTDADNIFTVNQTLRSSGVKGTDADTVLNFQDNAGVDLLKFGIEGVPVLTGTVPTDYVAYWSMDNADITGVTLYDTTVNNIDATLENTPTTGVAGQINEAVQFNGVTNQIALPNNAIIKPANVSVACWVNTGTLGSYNAIFSTFQLRTTYSGYMLRADNKKATFLIASNTGTTLGTDFNSASGGIDLDDGNWHFLVGTYDGSTIRTYVDGTEVGNTAYAGGLAYGTANYYIGASHDSVTGSVQHWSGIIDVPRVFNRALTATEVQDMFYDEGGSGGPGATLTDDVVLRNFDGDILIQARRDDLASSYTKIFTHVNGSAVEQVSIGNNVAAFSATITGDGSGLTNLPGPTGYNNTNWDNAYGWGDHAGLYVDNTGFGATVGFIQNDGDGTYSIKTDVVRNTIGTGTDNSLARFHSSSTRIQGSGITVDDSDNITGVGSLTATSFIGDGSGLTNLPGGSSNWTLISANHTAAAGEKLAVDTSGGAITITLPLSASVGDVVEFIDNADLAANNLIIARNGHNIESAPDDLTVDTSNSHFWLQYVDGTIGWEVFGIVSGGGSGGSGVEAKWSLISLNHTAEAGQKLAIDTSGGAVTVTLPSSAVAGDIIQFIDNADLSVNNLIIARNGHNIEGLNEDVTVSTSNALFWLQYIDVSTGWEVFGIVGGQESKGSSWTSSGSSTTLVAGEKLMVTATGSPLTYTLPATLTVGEEIIVHNNSTSTQTVSIDPATHSITGAAGTVTSADTLTLAAGETAHMVARTTAIMELV